MKLPLLDQTRLLVEEYHVSGISGEEFARLNGVSEEQLYWMERRVQRSGLPQSTPSFIEIKEIPDEPGYLRISCAGVSLGISANFNHQTMSRFLKALLDVAN